MKTASQKQEEQIAKFLGGKVQSNSGGTRFGGGDVHTKLFLIEAKTPEKQQQSFTVQFDWIAKAVQQSLEQNKQQSAIAIRFDPEGNDYYIIDKRLMKILVDYLEEETE